MPAFIDLSGLRLGRWAVLERAPDRKPGVAQWFCRCDCGTEKIVPAGALRNGKSTSCGCYQKESAAKIGRLSITHGYAGRGKSPTYSSWNRMRQRCENPNSTQWFYYGGRGIKVCDSWQRFENFLTDMGERPPNQTLDRKDGNGNYEPGNCRWATQKVQANNQRRNRRLIHHGETLNMTEWAERTGLRVSTIWARLNNGWTTDEALSTPAAPWRR